MNILDRLNLAYIWTKSYPALLHIWGKGVDTSGKARVNYGHETVPEPDEQTYGGLVKLQDLNTAFPQCIEKPNILYLVSSALPYFPVRMARLAKKSGAVLIINQNGVAYPGWHGKGWERANRDMKRLVHMADYVFYQSRFCKESADLFLGERQNRRQEVLYNPVDTSVFRPHGSRDAEGGTVMLLAGSHWSPYRVMTAVETLGKVRKENDRASLRIAGRFCWRDEKDARREVIARARELGVDAYVDITGPYTQEQAPDLFNQCSVLLHTKYNDPCPRLVIEAMACGLPVVYSATGGVPELVGDEAGEGVPGPLDWNRDHPPDPAELADATVKVLANYEGYSGKARLRAVNKFDVKPWLLRHEEIFQQVLQESTAQ